MFKKENNTNKLFSYQLLTNELLLSMIKDIRKRLDKFDKNQEDMWKELFDKDLETPTGLGINSATDSSNRRW
jgi:hypothetical protein